MPKNGLVSEIEVSPYYWENVNPSALMKCHYGELVTVGSEFDDSKITPHDESEYSEFEQAILNNATREAIPFRNFIEDGQKFGTVNVTSSGSACFELLKKLYGSFIYIVFEERAFRQNDPRLKHIRHVLIYDEYFLSVESTKWHLSDSAIFNYMTGSKNRPTPTFLSTQMKLFRNGFCVGYRIPTRKEYYSDSKINRLDSSDIANLFWIIFCSIHRDESLKSDKQTLAWHAYHCNVVGFGWLPCLLAKKNMNELDLMIKKGLEDNSFSSVFADIVGAAKHVENQKENCEPYGSTKLLCIKSLSNESQKFIPLRKVESIKTKINESGDLYYEVTDADHKIWIGDLELVDDAPVFSMKETPDGTVYVSQKYLSGRNVICEINNINIKTAKIQ